MNTLSINRQKADDIVGCCCDYNKGRLGFIVHCGATNQQQMPRAKDACLHLLRISRLESMPLQYIKRRTVKPVRVKAFR